MIEIMYFMTMESFIDVGVEPYNNGDAIIIGTHQWL